MIFFKQIQCHMWSIDHFNDENTIHIHILNINTLNLQKQTIHLALVLYFYFDIIHVNYNKSNMLTCYNLWTWKFFYRNCQIFLFFCFQG